MSMNKRNGDRRRPRRTNVRPQGMDAYYIITDGEQTEVNYFEGLKRTLPQQVRSSITIASVGAPQKLLPKVQELRQSLDLRRYWIVFDRDEVPNFDEIVANAERQGIAVGWSNPCFEFWLAGYFTAGSVPNYESSKECVAAFEKLFKGRANFEYKKNVQNLYDVLKNKGDERAALQNAETKHRNERAVKSKPSEMRCTTVYRLVKEIVAARDGFSAR
ncbi:MAG: RloB domain-containing protein [Thermoguttaceae bacterium]|nr:RloB domain-containing protein [Thermoguttaceae bacterium]MBQ7111968.1 RloB domain-containing protein [Thermoguttaceae bacterium]